ncbi:MAG TPA: hypothetical protein DCS69_14745, partial [Marinobacter adhaerens]|nr:hypothetical protein [Marinobacter adhaerens]
MFHVSIRAKAGTQVCIRGVGSCDVHHSAGWVFRPGECRDGFRSLFGKGASGRVLAGSTRPGI